MALGVPTTTVQEITTSCSTDPRTMPSISLAAGTDLLVVSIAALGTENNPTSVTWNGSETMTLAEGEGDNNFLAVQYYLANPTTGSHTLEINWNGTPDTASVSYHEFTNADTVAPLRVADKDKGNPTSLSFAGGTADDLAVAIASSINASIVNTGTLIGTALVIGGSGCTSFSRYTTVRNAGSQTIGVTISPGQDHALAGGAYKEAAGATLEQEGYRFRNDDGSESGATWAAAQDINITEAQEVTKRLRVLINATNDPASANYQLEVKKSTDPDTAYFVIGAN